jgi:hypothetical protein
MEQLRESLKAALIEFIRSQEFRDLVRPLVRAEMKRRGILPPEAI